MFAIRNKCHASRNKCLTSSNKTPRRARPESRVRLDRRRLEELHTARRRRAWGGSRRGDGTARDGKGDKLIYDTMNLLGFLFPDVFHFLFCLWSQLFPVWGVKKGLRPRNMYSDPFDRANPPGNAFARLPCRSHDQYTGTQKNKHPPRPDPLVDGWMDVPHQKPLFFGGGPPAGATGVLRKPRSTGTTNPSGEAPGWG